MLAFAPGFDQTFDQQMYNNLPDKIWKVCKNGLCVICTYLMSCLSPKLNKHIQQKYRSQAMQN